MHGFFDTTAQCVEPVHFTYNLQSFSTICHQGYSSSLFRIGSTSNRCQSNLSSHTSIIQLCSTHLSFPERKNLISPSESAICDFL